MGNRGGNLECACEIISNLEVKVLEKSNIYETEPWGVTEQAKFLNQAVKVETDLSPESLVCICKEVERQLGRVESMKWGPRIIDVDVLFYEDRVVEKETCTIPHRWLHERRFALKPLSEIAGDAVHPVFNKTIFELLESCTDKSDIALQS